MYIYKIIDDETDKVMFESLEIRDIADQMLIEVAQVYNIINERMVIAGLRIEKYKYRKPRARVDFTKYKKPDLEADVRNAKALGLSYGKYKMLGEKN